MPASTILEMSTFECNNGHAFAIQRSQSGDDRRIVSRRTVTMELDELSEHPLQVIAAGEATGTARPLNNIPGGDFWPTLPPPK